MLGFFFFSSRRRHTRCSRDWSSDVCSSDLIERMVEASGLSKPTILKGIRELGAKRKLAVEGGRVQKPGGGRKPIEDRDPHITRLLEQVMAESTVGDPMSPLKWNSKSTYQIQQHLASQGHRISEDTIQRRLRKLDYSLQANRKDKEGKSHADRDRQFRYLSETAKRFLRLRDRKSTRLNSSHGYISYAVFCLKKKTTIPRSLARPLPRQHRSSQHPQPGRRLHSSRYQPNARRVRFKPQPVVPDEPQAPLLALH